MFAGTAEAYQESLGNEPMLIATALATVFIVLGMLYESYIHPITILSTLPSAGVGAHSKEPHCGSLHLRKSRPWFGPAFLTRKTRRGLPHCGQAEGGDTTDSWRGTR